MRTLLSLDFASVCRRIRRQREFEAEKGVGCVDSAKSALAATSCLGENVRTMAKNKKNALQQAASRKLAGIGPQAPSAEQVAHMMLHAEERGEVSRVSLEDGSWGWARQRDDGQTEVLRPTREMLEALARWEHGAAHPQH